MLRPSRSVHHGQANTVSNDTYSGGGAGNSASGILILNAGTVNVQDNKVSDSDVNIYAGEVPHTCSWPTPGVWTYRATGCRAPPRRVIRRRGRVRRGHPARRHEQHGRPVRQRRVG